MHPETAAGWRQLLNALAPLDRLPLNAASGDEDGGERRRYEAGARQFAAHEGREGRKRPSLVATAHKLLGRLSRGSVPAAPAADTEN